MAPGAPRLPLLLSARIYLDLRSGESGEKTESERAEVGGGGLMVRRKAGLGLRESEGKEKERGQTFE